MSTAFRLAAVCAIVLSGVFAVRTGLWPSSSKPTTVADAGEIGVVNLVSKTDKLRIVDDSEKKVVNIEPIHTPSFDANAKAQLEPERETHRRRTTHRHWHRGSRGNRRP
jgi:hypothetical protein